MFSSVSLVHLLNISIDSVRFFSISGLNAIQTISLTPIIWQIHEGKKRPSEFLRGTNQVDRRVLNQHLSEMVSDGLLTKKSFHELPPRVEYQLTELGQK
ncbi:winged helix-turn-helix transcriptional regulator [Sinomicrobium sp. M5D2P9]